MSEPLESFAMYVCPECASRSNLALDGCESYGPCEICHRKGINQGGYSRGQTEPVFNQMSKPPDGDDMGAGIARYIGKIIIRTMLIGAGIGLAIGAIYQHYG